MTKVFDTLRASSWGIILFCLAVKYDMPAAATAMLSITVVVCGGDVALMTYQFARKLWLDWVKPVISKGKP